MIDLGNIDAMEQHIGYAEHIRKLLLFNSVDRRIVSCLILGCFDLGRKHFQPTGQETTGTAGKVYKDAVFDTNRKSLLRHISAEKGLK